MVFAEIELKYIWGMRWQCVDSKKTFPTRAERHIRNKSREERTLAILWRNLDPIWQEMGSHWRIWTGWAREGCDMLKGMFSKVESVCCCLHCAGQCRGGGWEETKTAGQLQWPKKRQMVRAQVKKIELEKMGDSQFQLGALERERFATNIFPF